MGIVIMVGQLILGLSILVILHELGHFLAARAFGIKVDKFYLFFDAWGFSLFKFTYKDVEYGVGWLPLGGYVKIAGMIDESMDTEQMEGPPQPWEFRSKPAWQRLIVMLGGVFVNVVLAIVIFWVLTARLGETYIPNSSIKYGIVPGKIGVKMGLKAGDQIIAINGRPLVKFDSLISPKVFIDHTVLTLQRNGKTMDLTVPTTLINDLADYGVDGIDQFISPLPRTKFSIDSIVPGSAAQTAGLMKGDSITAVNGAKITFYDQLQAELKKYANKNVLLEVKRNNEVKQLTVAVNNDGKLGSKTGGFGISAKFDLPEEKTIKYGVLASLPLGAKKAWDNFSINIRSMSKVFKGEAKFNKVVAGPVAIATMFGSHVDWIHFWGMVGLLSMALAITNLLPIPALDGGHAVFLIIEMIKGKPLSDKFLERAQIVGFVLLITLMVFVFGNDIVKQVLKNKP
ncbi:MAG: metalloprotease RseP [Mucilaginibacter sp.]|uniref:RIP metalloprotease RseP n=1 Tax=Mucilaginibacter sp. TaxID=1882438 RepID=UPI00261BA4CC|nr:RIP metalloprotease RseP [Mucilaginibacter sp.]MDB5002954.1 metalloprotease RseP [Mucilaginibacter sp.]